MANLSLNSSLISGSSQTTHLRPSSCYRSVRAILFLNTLLRLLRTTPTRQSTTVFNAFASVLPATIATSLKYLYGFVVRVTSLPDHARRGLLEEQRVYLWRPRAGRVYCKTASSGVCDTAMLCNVSTQFLLDVMLDISLEEESFRHGGV
jgi:hypothetical protein